MQVVASLKARLFAFQTMIMQREGKQDLQILLQRVQKSVRASTQETSASRLL